MVRRFTRPESDTRFSLCLNCLMWFDERDIAERLLENGVISNELIYKIKEVVGKNKAGDTI